MGAPTEHHIRPPHPPPPPHAGPTSPTLAALALRLREAEPTRHGLLVEEFWRLVDREGTPLVEPLAGDPDHRAVTFLWRGHRATRQVLLLANRLTDRERLADSLLTPLPGTDIWYLTHRLRADHRASYSLVSDISPSPPPADPERGQRRLRALTAHAAHDPRNSRVLPGRWHRPDSSVFALPQAPPQPWTTPRDGIARGGVERLTLRSTALDAERRVWVYLPPGWAASLDVLVLPDGDMWFGRLGLRHTLDALLADRKIRPLAVLAPDAVDQPTRWREVGAHEEYVHFLAEELLPWARDRWPLSQDPGRTVIAGQSLGGMAALYAGLRRPDRFGRLLAQSPSLWWRPGHPPEVPRQLPDGRPWLADRFAERPAVEGAPRPRVHLEVGRYEGTMVDLCHQLRDTLDDLGHRVTLTEYNGGHDYACWRGGLADALVELLGDGAPLTTEPATGPVVRGAR
ncbi:enterochelin esterase [Streptomyces sp. NPDC005438]|uniref:enterochelin esterase n=1 Tax=Streptomyces sp. NPDC005438 TaxID=3156880 RepID=UPI0033AE4305